MRPTLPLRAMTCALAAAIMLTACNDDADSPTALGRGGSALAVQNSATMDTARALVTAPTTATRADTGRIVPAGEFSAWPFPSNLALTEAQKTQIRTLWTNYQQAISADSNTAQAIYAESRRARESGATREAVDAILARARPLEQRQLTVYNEYMAAIDRVFTGAQRTWLEGYRLCLIGDITPSQNAQVEALQQQYRTANASDIAAVQKALDDIMRLRSQPGASAESIESRVRTILDGVSAARQRLAAAQVALLQQINQIVPPRTCG